jgi:hypothetical protein
MALLWAPGYRAGQVHDHCFGTYWQEAPVRIGKPLLITTTVIGLAIGIYEGFHLAGALGFLLVTLIGLFGAGIAWLVAIVRAERRAEAAAERGPPTDR